jgi:hypothetical protein
MQKIIFFSVFFLSCIAQLYSQDIVHTNDGRTINVKVVEVGIDDITYTKNGGAPAKLPKSNVQKIVYSNGTQDVFKQATRQASESASPNQATTGQKPTESIVENSNTSQQNSVKKNSKVFNTKKGYIGIGFGSSIPLGDLADSRLSNPKSSFASAGGYGELEAGYYIIPYFAIAAKFAYSTLGIDDVAYKRANRGDFQNLINNINLSNSINGISTSYTLESTNASSDAPSTGFNLLGLKACLPMNSLSVELGLWIGNSVYSLGSANRIANYFDELGNIYRLELSTKEVSASSLSRGIDFQVKYDVSQRFTLGLGVGMFATSTDFGKLDYTLSRFENNELAFTFRSSDSDDDEEDIIKIDNGTWRVFNIGINLAYTFRKK